ncbi:Uncharacterized protein RNJ44_01637 [Nakaseomyces bracarensis]|uniref:MIF4G domain-containing protein n=1 Tax=Nakaseomyces bracarensis TaxID=273131 RepID=A0ABR4NNJ2_9SACH
MTDQEGVKIEKGEVPKVDSAQKFNSRKPEDHQHSNQYSGSNISEGSKSGYNNGGRGNYHNNTNNYNRNYQSRGNSNRYNKYNNNAGGRNNSQSGTMSQGYYNNYNGTGNNRYNNGYNKHSRSQQLNSAASGMQWGGYYGNQMYYYPQGMAAMGNPAGMDMAAIMAAQQSMMGSPQPSLSPPPQPVTPPTKKVEITKKTGEHLDLNEIRAQHQAKVASSVPSDKDDEKSTPSESKEVTPQPAETIATKEATPEAAPVKKDDASDVRRLFLEQVKLRKAAIEKAKNGESPDKDAAEKPLEKHNEEEETSESNVEVKGIEKNEDHKEKSKAIETTENAEDVTAPENASPDADIAESKPPTFAELLRLKKQKAQEDLEVTDEVSSAALDNSQNMDNEKVDAEKNAEVEVKSADFEREVPNKTETVEDINEQETAPIKKVILEDPKGEDHSGDTEDDVTHNEFNEPTEIPSSTPPSDILTMSQLLEKLEKIPPVEDIYSFSYPSDIEKPNEKYKKEKVKYTYGPSFLLQFQSRVKAFPDDPWQLSTAAKIVIPPSISKSKSRDSNRFNNNSMGGRMNDFRNGSFRGMDMRTNSKANSKRKSKRTMDDRRSTRTSYTSRRDRERAAEERKEEDRKAEVAPLVPSANRWVPKSKQKKETEKKLAPDGTEMLDKEEVERKMKSLLNKLTLEKFDPISNEMLAIANQSKWETEGETLKLVIEQVFHKACDEPHWSSMYAQLCGKIVKELDPEIKDATNEGKVGPKLVLHYLVARCHTEFEKGWTDKLPTKDDGSPLEPEMMSDEYYQAAAAKRRGLGLVRFIGFLYRLNLLTGKMMFECFRRLMKDLTDTPSEEILESVVELLDTVGEQFESDSFRTVNATLEGSALLDSLFQILQNIINEGKITSRIKFKLLDVKELREVKHWNSDKKDSGPKTIQQIHEEEEKQRALKSNSRQASRRVNNSNMNNRDSRDRGYYRRDNQNYSKDNFTNTRNPSTRYNRDEKKEEKAPPPKTTNMFSALMDSEDDE